MFTIDPKITDEELKQKNFLKVIFSMNNHQVATPEMSLEEARSYVFFMREGKKRFSACIGLHFLKTDRKLFYSHSANPFSEEELKEVEDEARNFAEDMGAMVDVIDFTNMSDGEQSRWIEDQSIFAQKPTPDPEPEAQTAAPIAQEIPPVTSVQPAAPAAIPQTQQAPVPQTPPAPPAAPTPQTAPPAVPVPQQDPVPQESVVTKTVTPIPVTPPRQQQTPVQVQEPHRVPAAPLAEAARKRQEIMQKAAKAGTAKAAREAGPVERPSPTGVVSRDREALARLLTSF